MRIPAGKLERGDVAAGLLAGAATGRQIGALWVVAFIVTLGLGLVVSTVAPAALAALSPDSVVFVVEAKALAERIRAEGWHHWSLAPNQQTPIGVAAAMFAVVGPWTGLVIVLNAVMYATVIVLGFLICRYAVPSGAAAWLGAAVLLLLPSAAMTNAVLHKDTASILGTFAVAGGMCMMLRWAEFQLPVWKLLPGLVICAGGAVLAWVFRPYEMLLLLGGCAVFASLAVGREVVLLAWLRTSPFRLVRVIVSLSLVIGLLAGLASISPPTGAIAATDRVAVYQDEREKNLAAKAAQLRSTAGQAGQVEQVEQVEQVCPWPLPDRFGVLLEHLATTRGHFLLEHPTATTLIDRTVTLPDRCAVVGYIPRAIQVGLFSPFPNTWADYGSGLVVRLAVAGEMALLYLLITGALIGSLVWGLRTPALPVVAFAVSLITVTAIAIPIVGTLYRMRLPYELLLGAVGAAVLAHFMLTVGAETWRRR